MNESRLTTPPSDPDEQQGGGEFRMVMSRPAGICLVLVAITFAVFWPLQHCGFINYDDPSYVTANPHVRAGLTWKGAAWAFGAGETANWHPLTWLSHMLDVTLFGLNPLGHHFMNVLFHAANVVLLFLLLRKMTGAHWRSAFVAALFALHPVHVESVAWIAERKDVLSTCFGLLSIGAYLRFAQVRRKEEGARSKELEEWRKEQGARSKELEELRKEEGARRKENGERSTEQGAREMSAPLFPFSFFLFPFSRSLLLALLFFALSLMAKPMLVTLPFVLLLLDYWPLGRMSEDKLQVAGCRLQVEDSTTHDAPLTAHVSRFPSYVSRFTFDFPAGFWGLVVEKIPFFALSAVSCLVTFLVQRSGGAVVNLAKIPLGMRIENVFVSYVRYLEKLLWPASLALPYPYPAQWPWILVLFSILFVVGMSVFGWWFGRRWPFVRTGWFWFLGTLVPVIGLVQVGNQSLADRYEYVPSIGIFILLTWSAWAAVEAWIGKAKIPAQTSSPAAGTGLEHALDIGTGERLDPVPGLPGGALAARSRIGSITCAIVVVVVLGACAARTMDQLRYWRNSETLFRHSIAVTRNNGLACDNLGSALLDQGRVKEAADCYQVALRIHPNDAIARDGLGCCLFDRGRTKQAIECFRQALRINPEQVSSLFNLGGALAREGRYDEAMRYFDATLQREPDHAGALVSLGMIYLNQQRYVQAEGYYEYALQVKPDSVRARMGLGVVFFQLGRFEEAVRQYREAVRLAPTNAEAHLDLARTLARIGRRGEAIAELENVLRLEPNNATAKEGLEALGTKRP